MSTDILRRDQDLILRRSADILRREDIRKDSYPRRRRIIHLLAILLPAILFGYVILGYLSFILGKA